MKLLIISAVAMVGFMTSVQAQSNNTRNQQAETINAGENDDRSDRELKNPDEDRNVSTNGNNDNSIDRKTVAVVTAKWPEVSRRAANELVEKYGEPDIINQERAVWKDKGNWEMIIVNRDPNQKDPGEKELARLKRNDKKQI